MGQVLEAKESFVCELSDGRKEHITAGSTRVDESHELARLYPQHFKPIEANFGVEAATDAPGEFRARVASNANLPDSQAKEPEVGAEGTGASSESKTESAKTESGSSSRAKRSTTAK